MKHFHCFLDEEVDGMTLQQLAMDGTTENLRQCGITKLHDELKFRRLVKVKVAAITTHPPITMAKVTANRKLTKQEMGQLPPEKQTYLIKWVQLSIWAFEMSFRMLCEVIIGLFCKF